MNPEEDAVNDRQPPGAIDARLLALEAQTQTQQSRLRDYEKALVERIADVDDDRRRAAAQLKRAIESARGDQELRLRHRTRWLSVGLVLALMVALAGLSLALYLEQERRQLAGEVSHLSQELEQLSHAVARGAGMEGRLAEVEARMAEIGARFASVDGEIERALAAAAAAERIARSEERARLSGEIERLETVQDDLAARLEAAQRELAARLDMALQTAPEDGLAEGTAPEPEAGLAEPLTVTGDEPPRELIPPPGIEPARLAETGAVAEDAVDVPAGAAEPSTPAATLVTETVVYALQLIGFHDLERLREFALDERLSGPVWRLAERYRGRPWYPLIQGLYPDYAAAQAARAQLPDALRGLDPWIRPLPAGSELWTVDLTEEAPVPSIGPGDPDTVP